MDTKVVSYRPHDQLPRLVRIDEWSEEQFLFLAEVPDRSPQVEVDEIVRDVSALRFVHENGSIVKSPALRQHVVMIMGQRHQCVMSTGQECPPLPLVFPGPDATGA